MHGFFIPGFPKLIRFQEHHDKILMKKLRRLQKHLIANGVDTGIYTLKWFFQCFLDRMPYSLTIRVWDLYRKSVTTFSASISPSEGSLAEMSSVF